MRSLLIATILAYTATVLAQSPRPLKSPDISESVVLAAANDFYAAFLNSDVETISRMTADDYLQTDVNGKIQART